MAPSTSSFGIESQAPHSRAQKYPAEEPILEERKHAHPAQTPITFAEQTRHPSSSVQEDTDENRNESGGGSYEEDDFIDGEETTSKEVQRPAYDVESITDQRFTPVTTLDNQQQQVSQKNLRYVPMANSVGASSEALESAGQAMRPSAIDTILNERSKPPKPANVSKDAGKPGPSFKQPGDDDDDDDDYEEDYNDDDDSF